MDWVLKHKIISVIIAVAVAFGGWYLLSGSSPSQPVLTTTSAAGAPAGAQNLVESLLALRAVSLDGTLFSNPAYRSLQDFSTPILPEPAGRSDPFAGLSGASTTVNGGIQNPNLFAPATQ